LLLFLSCQKTKVDSNLGYEEFIQTYSKEICSKVFTCYNFYYRTIPDSNKLKQSQLDCYHGITQNLKEKIATQNEAVRLSIRSCYTTLLNSDCKKFMVIHLTDPQCRAAMQHGTEHILGKY
jgi:hypothetical protein